MENSKYNNGFKTVAVLLQMVFITVVIVIFSLLSNLFERSMLSFGDLGNDSFFHSYYYMKTVAGEIKELVMYLQMQDDSVRNEIDGKLEVKAVTEIKHDHDGGKHEEERRLEELNGYDFYALVSLRAGKPPTAVGGVSRAAAREETADSADRRGEHDAGRNDGKRVAQSRVGVVLQPFDLRARCDHVHIKIIDNKITCRAADHAAEISHFSRKAKAARGIGDEIIYALEEHGGENAD